MPTPDLVVRQVMEKVEEGRAIDFISLSGSGEPSLSADMGLIIGELKRQDAYPSPLSRTARFFFRDDVKRETAACRPRASVAGRCRRRYLPGDQPSPRGPLPRAFVSGLKAFRKSYKGKIWLEIMLIKNINDDPQQIDLFKEIISGLRADMVQLNTVTRPPGGKTATPVEGRKLAAVARRIGPACEVIAAFDREARTPGRGAWQASVIETLKRRSLSLEDIVRTTGVSRDTAKAGLRELAREGRIKVVRVGRKLFYTVPAKATARRRLPA